MRSVKLWTNYSGLRRKLRIKKEAVAKDERTIQVARKIATQVYALWFSLLIGDLLLRQIYLHQPPAQYLDIVIILTIGTVYFAVIGANNGLFSDRFSSVIRPAVIGLMGALVICFIKKRSVSDLLTGGIIGGLFAAGYLLILHYLGHRWKKKNNLTD